MGIPRHFHHDSKVQPVDAIRAPVNPSLEQRAEDCLALVASQSPEACVRAVDSSRYRIGADGSMDEEHRVELWARARGSLELIDPDDDWIGALLSRREVARCPEEPVRAESDNGPTLPASLDAARADATVGESTHWLRTETLIIDSRGRRILARQTCHWRQRRIGSTAVVSWLPDLDLEPGVDRAGTSEIPWSGSMVLSSTASLSLAALIAEDLTSAPGPLGRRKLGAPALSITRDPQVGGVGAFDAEGTPRRYGPLLYHGVFTGLLTDRELAAEHRLSRSLGCLGQSGRGLSVVADSLVVSASSGGPGAEAMIRDVGDGLWLRGQIERTTSGLRCALAQPIANGKPHGDPGPVQLERGPLDLARAVIATSGDSRPAAIPVTGGAPLIGRAPSLQIRPPRR